MADPKLDLPFSVSPNKPERSAARNACEFLDQSPEYGFDSGAASSARLVHVKLACPVDGLPFLMAEKLAFLSEDLNQNSFSAPGNEGSDLLTVHRITRSSSLILREVVTDALNCAYPMARQRTRSSLGGKRHCGASISPLSVGMSAYKLQICLPDNSAGHWAFPPCPALLSFSNFRLS